MTLSTPILAVLRIPQRTFFDISFQLAVRAAHAVSAFVDMMISLRTVQFFPDLKNLFGVQNLIVRLEEALDGPAMNFHL